MLEIDGSAGGGQLLRTALSLSAVTEQSVTVTNVRGARPDPGLKPQHLTAVQALTAACDATVDGATLGSEEVVFQPGTPEPDDLEFDIGTAGALTLVFDAVLPLAVAIERPLSVTVSGGTAVKWAPPLTTYRHVKLPLCREFGLAVAVERHQSGFYPAGGGEATLHLWPATLSALSLGERGCVQGARIYSRASHDLGENGVARRQAETAHQVLDDAGVTALDRQVTTTAAASTGSALTVELVFERTRAGFDALGEPRKAASTVGRQAAEAAVDFAEGCGAVDTHLADQLLVFLALAGGTVVIPERTAHVETSLSLLDSFGFDLAVEETNRGVLLTG